MDPATQRMNPRVEPGQPGARNPGYPVPVLPRPRPDEVPAPPLPERGPAPASGPGRAIPDPGPPGGPNAPAAPRQHAPQAPQPPAPPAPAPQAQAPRAPQPQASRATQVPAPQGQPESAPDSGDGGTESNGLAGWDLVRATQAGDQRAFGQLYDRYNEMVFRYVLFRVGDRQLAEDLTAETFLRALRRIQSVSYQGRDIGAWFVTIARNLVLDHVKSSRYRLEQTTSEIADLSPATSGPEQQVLDGATHEELLRCVAKLNADQKECITLRFLQGLSVAETASIMERNEGAVKALQHRAVRRLAQLLPEGLR
jgi:RNA polymerase sigma-70 factor, ECF subfamily